MVSSWLTSIPQVSEKLQSKDPGFLKVPKAEQVFISSTASSLVSLLTVLAEAQDDILESISQNALITRLLFILISYTSPEEDAIIALRSDALACLMILCEDNAKLSDTIAVGHGNDCYVALLSLKSDLTADGVLSCGVLHNIFASLAASSTAIPTAQVDDSILIPTLTKTVATITPAAVTNGGGWSNPVECQQLALEVLASIGTTLVAVMGGPVHQKKEKREKPDEIKVDEDMGDVEADLTSDHEDADEDEEDDEMDEDEMEADMDMVTGGGDDDDDNINDLPTLKALLQMALPELIRVACLQPSDENSMRLQSLALSALNNVAWSLSVVDFTDAHNAGIQKAWVPTAQSIWAGVIGPILSSDTADIDLATQVTGLAWAISRAIRGSASPLAADEHHRKFISLYQATRGSGSALESEEDPFQGLGVKCIGVLGQLALDPAPVALNREIGTFLITIVAALPDTPPADVVEALNQLFDIYADEEPACDKEVFWQDNFLKHLEEALPKVRSMAKGVDRKKHAELRTRAEEVVLNLTRFLAYKRKHKP